MKRSTLVMLLSISLAIVGNCFVGALADDDAGPGPGMENKGAGSGPGGSNTPEREGHPRPIHRDGLIKQVLTPDQTTKYEVLKKQTADANQPLMRQLRELHEQQKTGKSDAAQDQKISDLRDQIQQNNKDLHQKVDAMLSSDQKQKLKTLMQQARENNGSAGSGASTGGSSPGNTKAD